MKSQCEMCGPSGLKTWAEFGKDVQTSGFLSVVVLRYFFSFSVEAS